MDVTSGHNCGGSWPPLPLPVDSGATCEPLLSAQLRLLFPGAHCWLHLPQSKMDVTCGHNCGGGRPPLPLPVDSGVTWEPIPSAHLRLLWLHLPQAKMDVTSGHNCGGGRPPLPLSVDSGATWEPILSAPVLANGANCRIDHVDEMSEVS